MQSSSGLLRQPMVPGQGAAGLGVAFQASASIIGDPFPGIGEAVRVVAGDTSQLASLSLVAAALVHLLDMPDDRSVADRIAPPSEMATNASKGSPGR